MARFYRAKRRKKRREELLMKTKLFARSGNMRQVVSERETYRKESGDLVKKFIAASCVDGLNEVLNTMVEVDCNYIIGKYVKAGKRAFAYREKSDASQDITEWIEQFYELFDSSSDLFVILSEDISQSEKKQMELAIPKAVDRFLELKKAHTNECQEEVELPIAFYFMAKKKTNPTILFLHDYERKVEKICCEDDKKKWFRR